MVYEVEIKKGMHKEKKTPDPLAKWEATINSPYRSLPVPQRYLLQHHLSTAYGRGLAKSIMQYVYDYLRQDCDVYAWWERGRKTTIFCQDQERFFQLFIQPKKQEYVKMGPEAHS